MIPSDSCVRVLMLVLVGVGVDVGVDIGDGVYVVGVSHEQ